MAGLISVELDTAQLAKFRKKVERWDHLPLGQRMAKGTLAAADYMVAPIRAATPRQKSFGYQRGGHSPGLLRKSVRARQARGKVTFSSVPTKDAQVGPTAFTRAWVIRGTGRHSLEGKNPYAVFGNDQVRRSAGITHPGSRPNPYVDVVARQQSARAFRIVSDVLWKG